MGERKAEDMIDGMNGIEAYLRDMPRAQSASSIISATGWDARAPRSVEAHGQEERDEDGHPVGTRVSVRFLMSGSGLAGSSTSSSSMIYTTTTFYAAVPVTEAGTYVSDQIVDNMKFTTGLMHTTWVPPTVRPRTRLR